MNGWTHGTGSTWAATNGHARKTDPSTNQWFYKSTTDADLEVVFDYENFDDSDLGNALTVRLRRVSADVVDLEARNARKAALSGSQYKVPDCAGGYLLEYHE